jgi:hypothetical protein
MPGIDQLIVVFVANFRRLQMPSGIDAVIANFGDYRQFSAIIANVRRLSPILAIIANFRRKKMSPFFKKQLLGSLFCINRQRFESKAPIFFGENSFPGHNIGPWPASHVIIFYLHVCQSIDRPLWCPSLFSAASQKEQKREIPCES